jgi:AcrR family transcriptional regulator
MGPAREWHTRIDDGRAPKRSDATRLKILDAARQVFAEDGFDRSSTRSIAAAAGVNSALIFRYFGSKAGLYEAAVLRPLQTFIEEFVDEWDAYQREPHAPTQTAAEWLGGLYDLFCEHRELVLALIRHGSRGRGSGDEASEVAESMTRLLDSVEVVITTEAERRGWSGFDTRMSIRVALGMAFSFAVLQDWFYAGEDRRPDRDEIVSGMVSFVLRSMSNPGGTEGIPFIATAT